MLFFLGALEACMIEGDAGIARGVDHEVERQAEGFVEMEGLLPATVPVLERLEASLQLVICDAVPSLHRMFDSAERGRISL